MPRLVIDFAEARPIFALRAWVLDRIRAALPPEWEVVVVESPASGLGDGGVTASAETLAAVAAAEVFFGFGIPASVLRAGPRLRWVHTGTAGVRGSLTPEMREREIVFTNSAGIHAVPMAEAVIGMMLHFGRGFDIAVRAQAERRWDKDPFDAADAPLRELGESTVGIVGYGGIGREVGWRARALGCEVLALRRRPGREVAGRAAAAAGAEAPEDIAGADPGVSVLAGREGLDRLLRESHYLVLCAPDTPETRGMIGRAELAAMRADAVLINVARGGLVDESALAEALAAGRLRGAGLDVYTSEPLPPASPLRELPNVLLLPHVSAYSHRFWERECVLLEENIARWLGGRELRNVVDREAGY